jgi:hypothetical protein
MWVAQSGDCALPSAEESAELMEELLEHVREALPKTRIVVQAPLVKVHLTP